MGNLSWETRREKGKRGKGNGGGVGKEKGLGGRAGVEGKGRLRGRGVHTIWFAIATKRSKNLYRGNK